MVHETPDPRCHSDLSDTQVIVYSRWDRSPDTIEDQVTYPIVTSLLGAPKVKSVRGFSDFGYSYVYVIFETERTYTGQDRVPWNTSPAFCQSCPGGQHRTRTRRNGLGWIYQYVLVDSSGKYSLAEMRSFQDWYLRYYLKSVPGVAEVGP